MPMHNRESQQIRLRLLLLDLLEHATQREHIYRHVWRPGDVILWDNRCLLHRAIQNFAMDRHRRIMRRIVVKGDAPY